MSRRSATERASDREFWSTLRQYLVGHRGQLLIVGLLLLGEIVAELLKPWPLKFVIDYLTSVEGGAPGARVPVPSVASTSVTAFLIFSATTILGFALFDAVVTYFGAYRRSRLGAQIGYDVRRNLFSHLQRLGLDFHYSQRSGELTTRVVNDTNHVEDFVAESLPSLLRVSITFVSMVAIMFWLDWRLALVTTVIIPPLMYVVIVRFVAAIKARSSIHRAETGSLTAMTQETLQSIQVVKAFSREDFTDRLFDDQNEAARQARLASVVVEAKFTPTIKTMVSAGVVMMLVFGVLRVQAGALSTGDLWIFLTYFRGIKGPLKELSGGLRQMARTQVRWDRLSQILKIDTIDDDPRRRPAPVFAGHVSLQDVHFGYTAADGAIEHVLRGISLDVAPGERVAIVGKTGAGKSTLVSLIAGLYQPQAGAVEIDGIDLTELQPSTVREQIAFVLQDSLLFATTIGQNIGYGRLDATEAEIVGAAKQARIHDFIVGLPDGYDTIVGERGTTLSGGQRQRIAIARAILRNARILILDEPVTGLDVETLDQVWSEMQDLMKGRTTVLITHDPALAENMDRVYHLVDGEIANTTTTVSSEVMAAATSTSDFPAGVALGQRLVVMGQGYVGLPLAIRAAACGFTVVGYDVDEQRVRSLRDGQSFVDDVADSDLRAAIGSGRYRPSSEPDDIADFDYAVIAVPTPLRDGTPDLSYIESAAELLGAALRPRATVILESTTYPGTTETCLGPILARRSGLEVGSDFFLGYSPERINPGDGLDALVSIPKVVAGVDKKSLEQVDGFYRRLVNTTVRVESTRVAEMTKLLENTFRHVNIALINELAKFSHELDIDIWEAIDAAATKPFGFMPFHPGPGVGGHCLPVDPSYLSWDVRRSLGQNFRFVELANDINQQMPDYVIQRVATALNERGLSIRGHRFLVLGLAYKANSGDTRESPAIRIAERLSRLGGQVRVVDPLAPPSATPDGTKRVELTESEASEADAVILLVDHDDFDYAMIEEASQFVFDCTHRLGSYPNIETL